MRQMSASSGQREPSFLLVAESDGSEKAGDIQALVVTDKADHSNISPLQVPRRSILVSLEMASLGANGIANETRMLTALLANSNQHNITGFIMESRGQFSANVLPAKRSAQPISPLLFSNFFVAMSQKETPMGFGLMPRFKRLIWRLKRHFIEARSGFALSRLPIKTYSDTIWRLLFAKTLSTSHRAVMADLEYVGSRVTVADLHMHANLPVKLPLALDTRQFDIALFHDARPFKLAPNTARVIRYHDAIPLLYPDLLGDGAYTTMHYRLLKAAAQDGWFVCNSEATRRELLLFVPEAEERSAVIPCAQNFSLSDTFQDGPIDEILIRRASEFTINPKAEVRDAARLQERLQSWGANPNYIISVAALEPKKNIPGMIAAYEALLGELPNPPTLVLVGSPAWSVEDALRAMRPHLRSGNLIHLQDVPISELMLLMKKARLCFFPSLAEGFGYPPIEALYAGTPSVVSDLPALRETMGDAAIYVDPTCRDSMVKGLMALLNDATGADTCARLLTHRHTVLSRYEPEVIAARWNAFLGSVSPLRPKKSVSNRNS
jgi:glycosyltransferase involved in cell wall biosynthesis